MASAGGQTRAKAVVAGVLPERVRMLTKPETPRLVSSDGNKTVLYWMSRDQRAEDNWAALHARSLAEETGGTMAVAFSLVPSFLGATYRHFHFMLKGLQETEQTFREKRVPFHLVRGQAVDTIPALAKELNVAAVVTDFCPLRVPAAWASAVAERLDVLGIPLHQVDAHNVVPAWVASPKQETAARTFRPKITALLPRFLQPFPPLAANEPGTALPDAVDWEGTLAGLQTDMSVGVVAWCKPGAAAGAAMLHEFAQKRLSRFSTERNDPNKDALSNLSPWIHFGQLSVQAAVLTLKRDYKGKAGPSMKTFVEEAVVRRELADNYCFYQPNYDTLDGAAGWARETLQMHAKDQREYVYSREELEAAQTHDDLWNAAQVQLVEEGKMHGFLRMYWAKKILEWTSDPATALSDAIYLNDRFSMDGRDPNGYVGCMWSICGVHDMGWKERPIFGKIRFMNYKGCLRKFKVKEFVAKYERRAGSGPSGVKRSQTGSMDRFLVKRKK